MYFHAKDFGKGSCTGHKLILKGTNFRLEQGSKICAFTLFKDLWDQVPLDSSQAYFWGHCKIGTNYIWFSDWLILLLIKLSLGQRCLMTWGKMSLQKVFFKLILLSSELFKSHAIYLLIRCDYDNCNNYLNQ